MPSEQTRAKTADYNRRGVQLQNEHRYLEALELHDLAIALEPDESSFQVNRAGALLMIGRFQEAIIGFTRAIECDPQLASGHNGLGVALHRLWQHDQAIRAFQRAIELNPRYGEALCNLGTVLREQGRLAEAAECFQRAVETDPSNGRFYRYLVDGISRDKSAKHLPLVESALKFVGRMTSDQLTEYHFALACVYEAVGRYDDAFAQLREGNAMLRGSVAYSEEQTLKHMATIEATFSAAFCARIGPCGPLSERPIFIVGMPRSGSTLVEQILAGHPLVHSAGELGAFDRALQGLKVPATSPPDQIRAKIGELGERYLGEIEALKGEHVTDKMPFNFRYLGLIHLALPNARIIALKRDALDVCFSNFATFFLNSLPFSHDLGELARYYRGFERLLKHWQTIIPSNRLLTIEYEDIVDDIEGSVRKLLDFCGLPWDSDCLAFYEVQRAVRTASHSQVRRPLYRDSLGRAERFGIHLRPLIDELNR